MLVAKYLLYRNDPAAKRRLCGRAVSLRTHYGLCRPQNTTLSILKLQDPKPACPAPVGCRARHPCPRPGDVARHPTRGPGVSPGTSPVTRAKRPAHGPAPVVSARLWGITREMCPALCPAPVGSARLSAGFRVARGRAGPGTPPVAEQGPGNAPQPGPWHSRGRVAKLREP